MRMTVKLLETAEGKVAESNEEMAEGKGGDLNVELEEVDQVEYVPDFVDFDPEKEGSSREYGFVATEIC